jgi:hypothetical protein
LGHGGAESRRKTKHGDAAKRRIRDPSALIRDTG